MINDTELPIRNYEGIVKEERDEGPLSDRAMSGFPLSIGTSLALTTLFEPIQEEIDPDREVTRLEDLSKYDLYVFNVETLVRNILSSVPSDIFMKLKPGEVYETLVEELEFIIGMFGSMGLSTKFFINTYRYFKDQYKDDLRVANTPKQLHEQSLTNYALDKIKKDITFRDSIDTFTHMVSYRNTTSLIFTHIPADLLSYDKFRVLDLLESHTGAIKTRKDFNSKYYPLPREDMSSLPFFEYLLTTFGDKVMFKPKPIKERKKVFNDLIRLNVNPLSSEYSLMMRFGKD